MRDAQVDSKTRLVPKNGAWVVERVNDSRNPTKVCETIDSYPTQADAFRAWLTEKVRWGQWRTV